jgi:hypothetical protein
MEKGINLSLTKSLAEFDSLLDKVIEGMSTKEMLVVDPNSPLIKQSENSSDKFVAFEDILSTRLMEPDFSEAELRKFQIGKLVKIDNFDKKKELTIFWIGFSYKKGGKYESYIMMEFNAKRCPKKYWDKINELIGASGKYYSDVSLEFIQDYMNAWIRFFLKDKYLKQFYDENIGIDTQKDTLKRFIEEVLRKIEETNLPDFK